MYNDNWLRTEYNTAVRTAQMGAEWNSIQEDKDIFPYLKYITAKDERVRHNHAEFDGVIRPVDDPFWDTHTPPNGFNCRCRLIQLNEDDDVFTVTPDENIKNMSDPDSDLFAFNPGKNKYIFDPSHPYFTVEDRYKVAKENNFGFPTPPKPTAPIKRVIKKDSKKPDDFDNLFPTIKIEPSFWSLLDKKLKLKIDNNNISFFKNDTISLNTSMAQTDYLKKQLIYHEVGHAVHNQKKWLKLGVETNKEIKETFDKLSKKFKFTRKNEGPFVKFMKKRSEYVPYLDSLDEKYKHINSRDRKGQISAMLDTLNALTKGRLGSGHSDSYWKELGDYNPMAELMAHSFENKFLGNEIFKNELPELYKETIILIDKLIK